MGVAVIESVAEVGYCSVDCDSRGASFAGADADGFFDIRKENFSVSDLASVGAFDDGLCNDFCLLVIDDDFDFNLWKEIDGVFGTPVDFGMALLTSEAFDFGNSHSLDSDLCEGLFDFFKLEWFNDSFDFFHDSADW